MDATQLPHSHQLLSPTPKGERRKGNNSRNAAAATVHLALPLISSRPVIARPVLVLCSASALPAVAQFALISGLQQRWPCRLRPCCTRRPPTGPPRSGRRSARRGRCGCRRRPAGGSPGRPRRPGSPCASRPSRPTSAATAGTSTTTGRRSRSWLTSTSALSVELPREGSSRTSQRRPRMQTPLTSERRGRNSSRGKKPSGTPCRSPSLSGSLPLPACTST